MPVRQRLASESETGHSRPLPDGYALPAGASHYLIRLFLACFGLSYFYLAGRVRETLPLSLHAVLLLVACYALANGILLLRRAAAGFTSAYVVVLLDLAMLSVIVLQDPYPASPVTILLLSAAFDLGQRFAPRVFTVATALALCILVFNLWARVRSSQQAMSQDGIWLTLSIGALMIYFYSAALAASAARTERRRTAAQLGELRQREQQDVEAQLRMARFSESLRAAAMRPVDFAERVLAMLVAEAGACAALLYEMIEGGDDLCPVAAHAMDLQYIGSRRIAVGEGLVGACAQHRKAMVLHEVPPGYFELVSGLGRGAPPHLYLMPLGFSTQLAGVLEFATMKALQESEMNLLERMLEAVAGTLLVIPRGPSQPEPQTNAVPTGGTS
ncbi:MAG: hypothetical protein JWR07_3465 [Nevskia sp.]|nr:hypothetical protein [Nevskia sp.]